MTETAKLMKEDNMTEIQENTRLNPNGKRRWKRRPGLGNPDERMQQLWEETQERANEIQVPLPKPGLEAEERNDLPMDHADRADEILSEATHKT